MLMLTVLLGAYCVLLATFLAIAGFFPQHQGLAWSLLTVVGLMVLSRKKVRLRLTSGGTAAWESLARLGKAGMLSARTGLILGRVPAEGTPLGQAVQSLFSRCLTSWEACGEFFRNLNWRKHKAGRLVRLPQAVHTSVYAPTGVGKGVSCIVPFLLTCDESCVIVDGKDGELARLTARARRRMGHEVILLDPSRVVTPTPHTLNPLDFIDRQTPRAISEAEGLANALVIRTGEEKEPHWLDRAQAWLAAFIASTLWYGQRPRGTRSLLQVANHLSDPGALHATLELMQASPEIWNGSLARMGGMLRHSAGLELSSTLSTVGRFTSFMNMPQVAESLRASSFDLSRLRRGRMSIYLIQRAEDTRIGSALLRLWLTTCIREVMKEGLNQKHKTHVVVDEAGSIGRMDCLSDVLNVGRGFGLRLQLYYQDIGQLKKCWENPQGVLANTTQIYFGCNDIETAQHLSKSIGPETIVVNSGGRNSGWSNSYGSSSGHGYSENSNRSYSGGTSSNWQQQSRELLKPDEIIALDPRVAITLTPGLRPIRTRLVRSYEEKSLFKRRGLLAYLFAAVWTLLLSASLLTFTLAAAVALTSACGKLLQQQNQTPEPAFYQLPPGYLPR
jgi:type IV secretion system protein VirD4